MINETLRDSQIKIAKNKNELSVNRIQACFKLMNIADDESLNAIFYVLKNDTCELVRHEAAFCLGETASFDAKKVLEEVLESDDSIVVKHECLVSLGTIGDEISEKLVEKYLNYDLEEISSSAIVGKERISQVDFFEDKTKYELIDITKNKNSNRNEIIQAMFKLQNIGDESSSSAIGNILLNYNCPIVRHEAAFALGEIATNISIEILEKSLETEKNSVVIHEILFALGSTGSESVIGVLEKYLKNKEYIVSESSKIAIDRIKILKAPYRGTVEFK